MAKQTVTLNMREVEALLAAINKALGSELYFKLRMELRSIARTLGPVLEDLQTERKTIIDTYADRGDDGELLVTVNGTQKTFTFNKNLAEVEELWNDMMSATTDLSHNITPEMVGSLVGGYEIDALELLFKE